MMFKATVLVAVFSLLPSLFADRVPVVRPNPNPSTRSVSFTIEEEKQAITFLYLVDGKGFERVGLAVHALSFTDKLSLNAITAYDLKTEESWTVGTTVSFRVLEWNGGGVFLHAGLAGTNLFTSDPIVLRPIYGVGLGTTWR